MYRFYIPLALILMRFGDLVMANAIKMRFGDSDMANAITSQILKDTRISQIVKVMAWHNG